MKNILVWLVVGVLCSGWLGYQWGYQSGRDVAHGYVKYVTGKMKAEISELQKCCAAYQEKEVAK